MLMKLAGLGGVINTLVSGSDSVVKNMADSMQKVAQQKQDFIDATKLMSSSLPSTYDRKTPTILAGKLDKALNNIAGVRSACEIIQKGIETVYQHSADTDTAAAELLTAVWKQFSGLTSETMTVDTSKEPKSRGMFDMIGLDTMPDDTVQGVDAPTMSEYNQLKPETNSNSLSSVPDANGNDIDLNNFQQIPLSTNYVEMNDPTRQKVMFAVGENLDPAVAKYWEDAGYPLDGFGILGIGCGESGGKQGSNLLFGTDGGSGDGTCVGAKTIEKGVNTVAASLLQTGVASTQAEAEDMARNDYFYKQLSALVGCATNAKNDGVKANTCWGVLDPNSTNLREAVPRWRNNYQNGVVDKPSGGTGAGGGRYTFWSNPNAKKY